MGICSSGLSRHLEKDQPELALKFNPANTEARVRAIADALGAADGDGVGLDRLKQEAALALRLAPVDARLYSLMGEAELQAGAEDLAHSWFELAQDISKTELHALQRGIAWAVETGDIESAVGDIDILLRRWPDKAQALVPIWPHILTDDAGFEAMAAALQADPPWRWRFFTALREDPAATASAYRMLVRLKDDTAQSRNTELAWIIGALIRQQNFALAHRLFLLTLSEEEQRLGGYVHNGSFAPLYTQRPFDWQFGEHPALQITLPQTETPESGAVVRFLNKPVKNISFHQYLSLPPGDYRFRVQASGRNLDLPKELFWSLRCLTPGAEIARLNFPEGSFSARTLSVEFRIEEGCGLELLRLETALIAESWRYRYSGTLTIHSVGIEQVGS